MVKPGKVAVAVVPAAVTAAVVVGMVVGLRPVPGNAHISGATQDPWAWQKPDANGMITYGDISSMPPPAGVTAAVSSAQALEAATSLQFGGLAGGEPRLTLRLAARFLGDEGPEAYRDRLAWFVEYPESPMILSGPPGLSNEGRATIMTGSCEFVIVIDATTAAPLTSEQVCRPRD